MVGQYNLGVLAVLAALLGAALAAQPAWTDTDQPVITGDGLPNTAHVNLVSWLKPESLDGLADAATISEWTSSDNGGEGKMTGATSSGTKPIVKRNMINGYHAARISKTSKGYLMHSTDVLGAASTVCTVFRVLTSATGASTNQHNLIGFAQSNDAVVGSVAIDIDSSTKPSGKISVAHDISSSKVTSTAVFNLYDWHVVCAVAGTQTAPTASSGSKTVVYMDGTVAEPIADAAMVSIATSAGVPASLVRARLGYVASTREFEGDIAEFIGFNAALTGHEVDRVGTYLARKYGLQWNRLGGSGAFEVTSNLITVLQAGNSGGARSAGEGPAAGGAIITISGNQLFPSDAKDQGTQPLLSTLKVTVGHPSAACTDPKRTAPCTESSLTMPAATDCVIWSLSSSCDNSGANFKGCTGSIQCRAPAGLGPGADVVIHWQGVPYTLNNWYHYQNPVVNSIVPSTVGFAGGDRITVKGKNFGPQEQWTVTTAGGATTTAKRTATVEIATRVNVRCTNVQWVSDGELVCTVPAIPLAKLSVDTAQRTLSASVVVDAAGARSQQWASGSTLHYSQVPSYYTCENAGTDSLARSDCYSCCRHACVSEEFALGAVRGASTYSNCDASCISYCGFSRRRALLADE
jgi:hypothetical protein